MSGRTFLDTNVLVHAWDDADPGKQERALEVIRQEANRGHFVISTQVLSEFYVVVTRKIRNPLSPEEAERAVQHLSQMPTMQVDAPMVLAAVRRSQSLGLSYWDALIVEAARVAGCSRLLTEDVGFGPGVDGLQVENPFAWGGGSPALGLHLDPPSGHGCLLQALVPNRVMSRSPAADGNGAEILRLSLAMPPRTRLGLCPS